MTVANSRTFISSTTQRRKAVLCWRHECSYICNSHVFENMKVKKIAKTVKAAKAAKTVKATKRLWRWKKKLRVFCMKTTKYLVTSFVYINQKLRIL